MFYFETTRAPKPTKVLFKDPKPIWDLNGKELCGWKVEVLKTRLSYILEGVVMSNCLKYMWGKPYTVLVLTKGEQRIDMSVGMCGLDIAVHKFDEPIDGCLKIALRDAIKELA